MAIADTAQLIASLELRDKFSATARAATGQLSALERATNTTGTRMSGLSRVSAGAGVAMGTFGNRLRSVGSGVAAVAGVGGLLGLATGFAKTITASRDFDVAMRRIVGLTDVTADQIGNIRKEILQLGPALGRDPQELADAFYFIASAGFNASEAMDVLKTSATAASAGMGQTQDVAQVLGAAINAYGHNNLTAAHAADVLTAAVHDGSAEAADFVGSLQYVIPTAAAVGVSLEDVTAAVAGMTLGGTDAETATVNLNQVLSQLLKSTPATEKGLKSVGLSAGGLRTELKEKGLLATLETLRDHFGDNTEAMAKTFGNVRALRGVLGLLNLDADQLHKVFGDTADATGELNQALIDTEGPGRKMDRAFASIQTTLINLGGTYLPAFADALAGLGDWLRTHQGDVINFGKGALEIVKTLGGVIGGVIGGLSKAWGAIPDPLKDLLIKGFVADRTIKFLFGFSPLKLISQPITDALGKIAGQFVANKLTPQLITTAAPIPVFVTNPGFGGPGGVTGGTPAAPGGGGFLSGFAKGAALIFGAAAAEQFGEFIGKTFFFDPTIKPAVKFEQTQFDKLVQSNDPTAIQHGLDAVDRGLADLHSTLGQPGSILGFAGDFLLRDQISELERQRTALEESKKAALATAEAAQSSNKTEQQILAEAKGQHLAAATTAANIKTLEQRLIRDPNFKPQVNNAAEFLRLLRRTSEFGAAGVGTDIELGRKTGRDPVGDAFVALARRLTPPALKSVEVQGEISRHIKALEQVQGRLLKQGNIDAARHAQRNINVLGRLIGEVDKTIPHFRQLEQKQEQQRQAVRDSAERTANHLRIMQSLERRTGDAAIVTSRKNFSPKVNVNVNATTTVSINDVVRAITHSNTAVGSGPGGPAPVGILG